MQLKSKLEKIVMADKQVQKAGDNSQQLQANSMVVNVGIDEKRAREIYQEMNALSIQSYTQDALSIANSRISEFESKLMPKMETVEGALEAFADPSFQLLLVEAQKTAASTERQDDYELLSELLLHRFQKGDNRVTRAGISRAVEIIDDISDDALQGLTISHALTHFIPVTGDVHEGLDVLNDLFGKIIYTELPTGTNWLDHLDILDAIRINSSGSLKKMQQYYSEKLNGYITNGIEKKSETFKQVIDLLEKNNLPKTILVENIFNSEFVRLNIPDKGTIKILNLIFNQMQNGVLVNQIIPLTEVQKQAIYQIYDLYKNDDSEKNNTIAKFMEEFVKRPYLKKLSEWWDEIPTGFQITSVGKVLAHANAQRCDENLPPLN